MKFQYYPETDMLYIMLQEGVSTESEEVAPCNVLDYNENNQVIGIEIEDASQRIDLSKLEVIALPLVAFAFHNQKLSQLMPQTGDSMVDDQQLTHLFSQALNDSVTAVQPIGVAYGSNRVYKVETASGQRYVVKVPKQVRESRSPFWQQLDKIFGINSTTQITALQDVAARLQQQPIVPVPQVIHVEPDASSLLDAPYGVVTYLAGTVHEPDEFPAEEELHYQLGQYIGYLHTQEYVGYGNVLMKPLQPKADFFATTVASMRRTIQTFWADQPELHSYLDRLTATTDSETIFSTANLIMIDISANQFVYDNNRIAGVVDLDAYVIGPREWELSILEMCITKPTAFQQGYECYTALPTFAPFRAFYRLWSYLNEPQQGHDADRLAHFMQQSIYFREA